MVEGGAVKGERARVLNQTDEKPKQVKPAAELLQS